ncbi:MAG TPA: pentapeptide repeat-containing protein [Acidobacteriota bacterium]|nr:pentapeptide repeat-containing protein [Acidobacteriota bacterium]HMZ78461.1 pentapeptide repeat-containing protein [Acidobacteriota bacterium]HNB71864.1 pentapeptide repeat-containing protein [Acidobacteriota bacterium]HNC45955.1 pentapeptide repeat-containing protein [Acidobacteriota bacterium]HNG92396.1 pentapeptide repeat-containing protein [Acidobacteriota bacterium]
MTDLNKNQPNQNQPSLPNGYVPPASVEELHKRYAAGERYFMGADIQGGANLQWANLEGANFECAILSDIDFRSANLQRVVFRNANVKCSDFRGANLEGADFGGANVEATQFEGANLSSTNFKGASYYGHILKAEDVPEWIKMAESE